MTSAREQLHRRILAVLDAAEPIGARVALVESALEFGRKAPKHRVYGALKYLEVAKFVELFDDALNARCARITDKGAVMLRGSRRPSSVPTPARGGRARTRVRRVPPLTWPRRGSR